MLKSDMADDVRATAANPGRRERNKQEKLSRIIEAARRLFREKGFRATTTEEIAREASVATGTLWLYVDSKEEILMIAFVDEILRVNDKAWENLPKDAPLHEQICFLLEAVAEYYARDLPLARSLLREIGAMRDRDRPRPYHPRGDPRTAAETTRAQIAQILGPAQAAGRLRPDFDPQTIGFDFFGMFVAPLQAMVHEHMTYDQFLVRLRNGVRIHVDGLANSANREI